MAATTAAPRALSWTLWPTRVPSTFGDESYSAGFLLKVDLPAVIGLLVLFSLPPIRAWTGCNPLLIVAGFGVHLLVTGGIVVGGVQRVPFAAREFLSNASNLAATVAIPLSSPKPLFVLWVLYLLVVWMDSFSNPKSAASFLLALAAPWADVAWHAWFSGVPVAPSVLAAKIAITALVTAAAAVIYLVAAYYAGWAHSAGETQAENARLKATLAERTRIGQNLHGTLGAALSEITLWHEVALAGGVRDAADAGSDAADPLSRAHARAKSALTELRALVANLDGENVPATGLAAGIRRQIEGLCAAAGVRLDFPEPEESPVALDLSAAYHVAKIAVEGVTNAVRHGRPRSVRVTLMLSPLRVEITDDGIGFDPEATVRGRGLRSLAEHAASLGGTLEVVSSPENGTRITVVTAMPAAEAA